jgi:hypothetical protein
MALLAAGSEVETAPPRFKAAKERVRDALQLAPDAALFTNVFVGEPVNGDTTLCGTVSECGLTERPSHLAASSPPRRAGR